MSASASGLPPRLSTRRPWRGSSRTSPRTNRRSPATSTRTRGSRHRRRPCGRAHGRTAPVSEVELGRTLLLFVWAFGLAAIEIEIEGGWGWAGAPADLVAKPWRRRARLRRRHGRPAAHGLPRLGVHDSGRRPAPPVCHGRRLDACRRAADAGDVLRARRRVGLPLVRAQPRLHGRALRAREGLVVRGALDMEVSARLLRGNRPLARPRRALGLGGRRCRAVPAPSLDAPRACDPGRPHRARSAVLPPLVPPDAPSGSGRPRRRAHLSAAGAGRGVAGGQPILHFDEEGRTT